MTTELREGERYARTAAIGNGMNDEAMLREAALGFAVIGKEGAAGRAVLAADVIVLSAQVRQRIPCTGAPASLIEGTRDRGGPHRRGSCSPPADPTGDP